MGRHRRPTTSIHSAADCGADRICVLILRHAIRGQAVLAIVPRDTIPEDAIRHHCLTHSARIRHHRLVGLTGALRRHSHRAHPHLRGREEE